MNLVSLQHLVRSVRTLAEDCQVIVLGSASLLVTKSLELGRPYRAPTSLPHKPRASPWAAIGRAFGAPIQRAHMISRPVLDFGAPTVQTTVAQGNALGYGFPEHNGALKGRLNS